MPILCSTHFPFCYRLKGVSNLDRFCVAKLCVSCGKHFVFGPVITSKTRNVQIM